MQLRKWEILTAVIIWVLVAAGILTWWSFLAEISPEKRTTTTMHVLFQRIEEYVHVHHALPKSLDELPEIPGKDNSLDDAWGKRIQYIVRPDCSVVLHSSGGRRWFLSGALPKDISMERKITLNYN